MEFFTKYLWNIFELVNEENKDGDDITVDLVNGPDMFLGAINGAKDCDYKCVSKLDKKALKAEWEKADQQTAYTEYKALVARVPGKDKADKCAELCAAFTAGDKKLFDRERDNGLELLYGLDGMEVVRA